MRPIPNYSRYVACEAGHLYSTRYKNSNRIVQLRPALNSDGYLKTMLQRDSDKRTHSVAVHRLVCEAYHGEANGRQVNHINGIKTDNRPQNLEWVTLGENIKHAYGLGLITAKRGSLNGRAVLVEMQIAEIRSLAKSRGRYYGRKQLADQFGVTEGHIKDIVRRRRNIWPHV